MQHTRTEQRLAAESSAADVEHQLQALVKDMNHSEPKHPPRPQAAVERIGDELAVSFGEAGQELLTKAQNIVADDAAFIDHIRAEIKRRVDIHTQFMAELQECDRDHKNARAKLYPK
jgi:hypothetical protein